MSEARFWSVSNEDAEYTKLWVMRFILAKKLGVRPQIPTQELDRLHSIWGAYQRDDVMHAEYKQLWREVEREINHDR